VRPAITPAAQAPAHALAAGQRCRLPIRNYAITTVSAEQLSSDSPGARARLSLMASVSPCHHRSGAYTDVRNHR